MLAGKLVPITQFSVPTYSFTQCLSAVDHRRRALRHMIISGMEELLPFLYKAVKFVIDTLLIPSQRAANSAGSLIAA